MCLEQFGEPLLKPGRIDGQGEFQQNLAGVARESAPAQLVIKPEHQGVAPVMTQRGAHGADGIRRQRESGRS